MSRFILSAAPFNDEAAAYAYVEARVWPNGRVCPHCGVVDRSGPLKGKTNRIGLYKCYACRKPFTVKVGTIFEDSHIALRDWLAAMYLICSSKKGISSNQLARTLGITLKSAWFLSHRIREAMAPGTDLPPMGGIGKAVEADETYIGKAREKHYNQERGGQWKMKVVTLVQRDGEARSFKVDSVTSEKIGSIVRKNVSKKSLLATDDAAVYDALNNDYPFHGTVNHGEEEWRRGDVYTNTVEGYFSIFKRGMKGVYQHCGEEHLHRYLAEFDFRYSNRARLGADDTERTARLVEGVVGKRLTYRTTRG